MGWSGVAWGGMDWDRTPLNPITNKCPLIVVTSNYSNFGVAQFEPSVNNDEFFDKSWVRPKVDLIWLYKIKRKSSQAPAGRSEKNDGFCVQDLCVDGMGLAWDGMGLAWDGMGLAWDGVGLAWGGM